MKIVKLTSYQDLCTYIETCITKAPDDISRSICEETYRIIKRAHKFAVKESGDENTLDIQRVNGFLGKKAFESRREKEKDLYISLLYKIDTKFIIKTKGKEKTCDT